MRLETLVVAPLLLACGPDRAGSDAGEETTGTTTESSSSGSSGAEHDGTESTATTATSTSASTDGPDNDTSQPDECDLSLDDCPSRTVCCQWSFADPVLCEPVPRGGCGGDVECPPGFECFVGGIHCGIGECVPSDDDTSGSSSSDTGASTEAGSSTG